MSSSSAVGTPRLYGERMRLGEDLLPRLSRIALGARAVKSIIGRERLIARMEGVIGVRDTALQTSRRLKRSIQMIANRPSEREVDWIRHHNEFAIPCPRACRAGRYQDS